MDLIQLSQSFLKSARMNVPAEDARTMLASARDTELTGQLPGDNRKKAFWINLYNAYTQTLLSTNPEQYARRNAFFGNKQIRVAGQSLSLDDIEHGLLRRSKIKWAFGYLQNPVPGPFEKNHRVDKLDFRIHFALNCGAASCPPIAFYDPVQLDTQLDLAMLSYLQAETLYDSAANIVYLPAVISWYRRDFGGVERVRQLLKSLALIPEEKDPAIRFKEYSWDLYLQNFTRQDFL